MKVEALYARITRFNRDYNEGSGGPGQKTKTVAALGKQANKPIRCGIDQVRFLQK